MLIKKTDIENLNILKDKYIKDNRGFFNRYFEKETFIKYRINFKPNYQSLVKTNKSGVIRGLYMQKKPFEEIKLMKCVSGSIFAIFIDLRPKSKSFLNIFKIKLKVGDGNSILIPKGCAHGYKSLENNSKILYSIQGQYSKNSEINIKLNDLF
jgi:dTDP-4-dehydrorhamnose 3,5-epimerase